MKYAFITQYKKTWPIDLMCRLLGVSRNAYYTYSKRHDNKPPDRQHSAMLEAVKEVAEASDHSYGTRRMKRALQALGFNVSRSKARKLMREAKVTVRCRKKYKVTTNSKHKQPVYDNVLDRNFETTAPDQAYVQDITYIWTQEGWLYLATVIDLFSRRVVGWSMGARMKASLVTDALRMAIWQRRPAPGLIVHSDRGSQYASNAFRSLLAANGFIGSMSRKGDCWDNAVAESFFASLKKERVQWRSYQTRLDAQQDVLNYISMFYNSRRLHSYLGYRSPMEFESAKARMKKAA